MVVINFLFLIPAQEDRLSAGRTLCSLILISINCSTCLVCGRMQAPPFDFLFVSGLGGISKCACEFCLEKGGLRPENTRREKDCDVILFSRPFSFYLSLSLLSSSVSLSLFILLDLFLSLSAYNFIYGHLFHTYTIICLSCFR